MSGKRRHRERLAAIEARLAALKARAQARGVCVDRDALAPNNSYCVPDFVTRGYYVDRPFICRDCDVSQIWTAEQQKWWYEVAKGDIYSTAVRCRPCRRRQREHQEASRLKASDPNS